MSQEGKPTFIETIQGRILRFTKKDKQENEKWSINHLKRNVKSFVVKYCYFTFLILCVILQIAAVISPAWLVSDNCWTGLFYKCCVDANNKTVCLLEDLSTPIYCLEFLSSICGLCSAVVCVGCLFRGVDETAKILKNAHFLHIGSGAVNFAACALFIPFLGRPGFGFAVCLGCSIVFIVQVMGLLMIKKPETGG